VEILLDRAGTGADGVPAAEVRYVKLVVSDDGAGFFKLSASRGLGLTGIRERVKGLGGTCHIDSESGRGTRITVCVPLAVCSETAA
jgi:signal transduction histidine kinase